MLRRLTIIVALQYVGSTLGLPLLALFLARRHGTPAVIGLVTAAFFGAGVVTQFAFGHLADRFGRQRILVTCLVVYGLASFTFLLPLHAGWFALTRALQGAAAGAVEVTALSAVASRFSEKERGRAFSQIFSAQLLGVVIGPMVGALATPDTLAWAFAGSGVLALVAALTAARTDLGMSVHSSEPLPPVTWSRGLVGALFSAATGGLLIGVYETCWSLLLQHQGASPFQIRLSWTLFALPFIFLTRVGGWLADHGNRRFIALAGLLNGAVFLSIYPHIHSIGWVLGLGAMETIGAAMTGPSAMSLLTQGAHDRELSRRQGLYATANTASLALTAALSGALYTIDVALPFTVVALLAASTALSTLWWWRGLAGHVRHDTDAQ